jgi:hypothetical protein
MTSLFEKAIVAAGFEPIKPVAQGAHLIHGLIIKHLSTADLVLLDLSSHNPNVFFELGVRTSLNLPIALVRDEHTSMPFDTSGINAHTYDSSLRGWLIENEQRGLAEHIVDSYASCSGQNPLWRQFGLTIRAQEPDAKESPLEAKVDLLTDRLAHLQANVENSRYLSFERRSEHDSDSSFLSNAMWRNGESLASTATPPSRLFTSAVLRYAADRFPATVETSGPTGATVVLGASARPEDVDRIAELAKRYEVSARYVLDERPNSSSARSRALSDALSSNEKASGKPERGASRG